jgi:hypothetical protein
MLDAAAYLLIGACPKIGLIKRHLREFFRDTFSFADGLEIYLWGAAIDTMADRTEAGIQLMTRR